MNQYCNGQKKIKRFVFNNYYNYIYCQGLWTNEPIIIDPIDRDNTPSINSKYNKSFTFSSFANSIGRKMS